MTDETTGPAGDESNGTASFDEALAEPVEGETGSDATDDGSLLDGLAASVDPDRVVDALRSDDPLRVRALRLAISTAVVFGFVAAFGAGAGAVVVLAKFAVVAADAEVALLAVDQQLVAGGALLLPVASFLFVAWYDGATLRWPDWPDGHPPLGDAWLFATLAYGVATIALPTGAWPGVVVAGGWVAAFAGAYAVLPVWLGWRCLEEGSWVLGVLAGMTGLLVPVATSIGYVVLWPDVVPAADTGAGTVVAALVVALVGLGLPFAFARWSPGPVALSHLVAAELGRVAELVRSVGRRLRAGV